TSYAAQGKTVAHVLFSDSAIRAATNRQQWYVTISRGRKGVKIFTTDKIQLRQDVTRSGDRTLALDIAQSSFHKLASIWGRSLAYVFNVQHSQRVSAERATERVRLEESERQAEAVKPAQALQPVEKPVESIKPAEPIKPAVNTPETIRRRIEISRSQSHQKSRGMRI
ncbi:MAG: hypothetical protein ABSF34_09405, partial [Verrucomicrobiota bacterium]